MIPELLQIITTCKSLPDNDWRSFLQWADKDAMMVYEIRGYGSSPCESLTDAHNKFLEDPTFYQTDCWEWV